MTSRCLAAGAALLAVLAVSAAAAGETEEPRVTRERPSIRGSMDRRIVERVVDRHVDELQTCYTNALQDDAPLTGRLVVKWIVLATGAVGHVSLETDEIGSQPLADCVTGAIATWQFPAAKGGGIVIVTMPFVFSAG